MRKAAWREEAHCTPLPWKPTVAQSLLSLVNLGKAFKVTSLSFFIWKWGPWTCSTCIWEAIKEWKILSNSKYLLIYVKKDVLKSRGALSFKLPVFAMKIPPHTPAAGHCNANSLYSCIFKYNVFSPCLPPLGLSYSAHSLNPLSGKLLFALWFPKPHYWNVFWILTFPTCVIAVCHRNSCQLLCWVSLAPSNLTLHHFGRQISQALFL